MREIRVGIIGCGRARQQSGATGYGMAHAHAAGYEAHPRAHIVALADIKRENAEAFQAEHGGERIYADYREMLAQEQLDMVSVCLWPHLHAPAVIAAAEAGVNAIHCEKPMAPTFGEARAMLSACEAHGVQLTIDHQRRFAEPFRRARQLIASGQIGTLQRLEAACTNLFDWGTHWFDMLCYLNGDQPIEWVLGQIEGRGGKRVFGVPVEGQGLSQFRCVNGVLGLLVTGVDHALGGADIRAIGTEGVIEVRNEPQPLRVWSRGSDDWQVVATNGGFHRMDLVRLAVLDALDCLETGREPELSGAKALRATELIFATYESSRRRGRVDLPLDVDDSPLLSMIASGEIAGEWPD